jgi:hypothetical protein
MKQARSGGVPRLVKFHLILTIKATKYNFPSVTISLPLSKQALNILLFFHKNVFFIS